MAITYEWSFPNFETNSEVQAVCNAVWTQSVKDAYATFLANQQDN